MGFVIGVEGRDRTVYGPYGGLTTLYDHIPREYGWTWNVTNVGWLWLPFVSYSGKKFLWYWGWRPASGGFGIKFNIHSATPIASDVLKNSGDLKKLLDSHKEKKRNESRTG